MSVGEGYFMFDSFSENARVLAISACIAVTAAPALALDVSPDLFAEGSCEDVVDWAAQPVKDLLEGFKAPGKENAEIWRNAGGETILKMTRSMPVADNWFEKKCTFTEAQLAGMGNLHTAYVAYLERMMEG
jgi:hypothetical protein